MPKKFQNKYRIQSTRLKNYDYATDGAYFITIVTKNRDRFFGKIENGKMILTRIIHEISFPEINSGQVMQM